MSTLQEDVTALADALEGKAPEQILAAVAPRFPGRIAVACSFGAEDCVLVDVVARHRLPVELFTLDTGFLFPETQVLWTALEARYGVKIVPAPASEFPSTSPSKAKIRRCSELGNDSSSPGLRLDSSPREKRRLLRGAHRRG